MLWIKEVNKSIKTYLQELYKDYNIPIKVFNAQTYASEGHVPCITLFAYDSGNNVSMTDLNSLNIIKKDKVATITQKEAKRNISVQLSFYTDSPSLLDELTFKWVTSKNTHDTFDITDSEGNVFVCKCVLGEPSRMDSIDGDVVLNRVIIPIVIILPVQIGKPQTVGIVETTNSTVINKDKEE